MTIRTISPYPVRMDADLRASLEAIAKNNDQSLHAFILEVLYSASDVQPPQDALSKRMRSIAREEIAKASKK